MMHDTSKNQNDQRMDEGSDRKILKTGSEYILCRSNLKQNILK
jgi:hypothetical protein